MASVAKRKWTYKGAMREAWVMRYKDKGGAHRSRQFDLKKDADAYKRRVENEMEAGTHVALGQTLTIGALFDRYEAHAADRVKIGAVGRGHLSNIANRGVWIKAKLGGVRLTELTWQQVEAFARELQGERKRNRFAMPLARRTVAEILSELQRVVEYAVRYEFVGKNVVATARKVIELGATERIEPFTRDEVKRIVEAIEDWPSVDWQAGGGHRRSQPMMRAIVYLAAFCGLRLGEILALRWSDIDLDGGSVNITQSLDWFDTLKSPKTKAGIRIVPLPSFVAAALEAFRPHAVADERGLIFRTIKGKVLGRAAIPQKWHPILERAGIPRGERGWRHFHALRHFAGSAWLDAGMSLADVSYHLGHANTQVTAEIYMHSIAPASHRSPLLEQCAAGLIALPAPENAQELRNAA